MGIKLAQAQQLALLAELHASARDVVAGLEALAEARTLIQQTGEAYCASELHRLQAEFLLQQDGANATEAETCFQQAVDIARVQQAKSQELRATVSIVRLWQREGKLREAYVLLEPIYHWFTEGFDAADLQEARALLEELEG
jgi:predicted ATPase